MGHERLKATGNTAANIYRSRSLTIVIPAYNEEEAIGATINRTLDGRSEVMERGGLHQVQIIVVDDGSTDATAQIAGTFEEIELVSFGANRGYGAAISSDSGEPHAARASAGKPHLRDNARDPGEQKSDRRG
jgi:GT2 family glycosyltransferase